MKALFFFTVFFLLLIAHPAFSKQVKLGWKKIDKVSKYHLQVDVTPNFTSPIVDKETLKNQLQADLPPGVYYLRVQGTDERGEKGTWSQPFQLMVTAPALPKETPTPTPPPPAVREPPTEVTVADNKNQMWFIDVGPVVTNSLVGSNGTKFNVFFGIFKPISEKFDWRIFYDANFNTGSLGGSAITEIGTGVDFFMAERLKSNSLFGTLDLGYGGANRNYDASEIFGAAIGYEFFRNERTSFEIAFHLSALFSSYSNLMSLPSWQVLRLGVKF